MTCLPVVHHCENGQLLMLFHLISLSVSASYEGISFILLPGAMIRQSVLSLSLMH